MTLLVGLSSDDMVAYSILTRLQIPTRVGTEGEDLFTECMMHHPLLCILSDGCSVPVTLQSTEPSHLQLSCRALLGGGQDGGCLTNEATEGRLRSTSSRAGIPAWVCLVSKHTLQVLREQTGCLTRAGRKQTALMFLFNSKLLALRPNFVLDMVSALGPTMEAS